jgi:hypothetical protein
MLEIIQERACIVTFTYHLSSERSWWARVWIEMEVGSLDEDGKGSYSFFSLKKLL